MKLRLLFISLFAFSLVSDVSYASGMVDSTTSLDVQPIIVLDSNYDLVFSDEFNGVSVDESKWTIDNSTKSRASRPGLSISQWYWRPANVEVNDGQLVLKVSKANASVMHCGAINSKDKFEIEYGYFEVSISIAQVDKGTHTAFWLQGQNMSNVDGTANDGAEIDVFESAWLEDYTKSVVHIDGYGSAHQANTKKYITPGIHSGFHTFSFHWTPDFMKIYYDGVLKVSYTTPQWIVNTEEFLWLSNGASFGIEGDYFSKQALGYLTEAKVEYVRVWQQPDNQIPTTDYQEPTLPIIAPNPTHSMINISSENTIGSIALYDIEGRCVKEVSEVFSSEWQLSLEGLAKGCYFLALRSEEMNIMKKIIYY